MDAQQLIKTQSADPSVLTIAAEPADVPAAQVEIDAAGNTVTAWRWKPPFTDPPGLGAGAGASQFCGGGGCKQVTNPTTVNCVVGGAMTQYTELDKKSRFAQGNFE
jgi:hypothetical protein